MMTKHNNKNGFTLIEIIVTVVILAVLMAVAMPTAFKYLSEGDNAKALDEAYACVSAGDYYGARAYMKQKDPSKYINSEIIKKKAQVNGTIKDFSYGFEDYVIEGLLYKSTNDIYVKYDGEKYEIVDANALINPNTANKVLLACQGIHKGNNLDTINNGPASTDRTQTLQKLYTQKYDGNYLFLSKVEKDMLRKFKYSPDEDKYSILRWKPAYMKNGDIFLMADVKTAIKGAPNYGATMGALIYYNGHYYYHRQNSTDDGLLVATDSWIEEGAFVLNQNWVLIADS